MLHWVALNYLVSWMRQNKTLNQTPNVLPPSQVRRSYRGCFRCRGLLPLQANGQGGTTSQCGKSSDNKPDVDSEIAVRLPVAGGSFNLDRWWNPSIDGRKGVTPEQIRSEYEPRIEPPKNAASDVAAAQGQAPRQQILSSQSRLTLKPALNQLNGANRLRTVNRRWSASKSNKV